jgi:hypothetical protein
VNAAEGRGFRLAGKLARKAPPLDGEGLGRGEVRSRARSLETAPPINPPPSRGGL